MYFCHSLSHCLSPGCHHMGFLIQLALTSHSDFTSQSNHPQHCFHEPSEKVFLIMSVPLPLHGLEDRNPKVGGRCFKLLLCFPIHFFFLSTPLTFIIFIQLINCLGILFLVSTCMKNCGLLKLKLSILLGGTRD